MAFFNVDARAEFAAEKMKKVGLFETDHLFCDLYCLEPGQSQKPHIHETATKFYFVLEGSVEAVVGDESRVLHAGDMAVAEPGRPHGIRNASDARSKVLAVMGPNPNRPGSNG
jgi:quercetin dioxygenase-like cupin family protein